MKLRLAPEGHCTLSLNLTMSRGIEADIDARQTESAELEKERERLTLQCNSYNIKVMRTEVHY